MPTTYQNNQIAGLIDINELLSLMPQSFVQSKQRLKGYSVNKPKDPLLSYLTAGEYYPIEPSTLTNEFWEFLLNWVSQSLGFQEDKLVACRCQFNIIPENASYHPLTISPHADSLSHKLNIAAINIPIQSNCLFRTAFWRHKMYGSYLGDFISSDNDEMYGRRNHPFHVCDINQILDDNQGYKDSPSLILKDWDLVQIVDTPMNIATLYDGRTYHSPYLSSRRIETMRSMVNYRKSLAIFLAYSTLIPHAVATTDSALDKKILHKKILDSLLKINAQSVPYKYE